MGLARLAARLDLVDPTSAAILGDELRSGSRPADLEALITPDEDSSAYLDTLLIDPWGKAFLYDPPSSTQPLPRPS